MAIRALGVVLLFSFVAVLCGLPTPESSVDTHEEHTLSTELRPPPLDENERYATVYVINLYAVKNGSSDTSEGMFENEVIQTVPDILEPFATVLLVVEDDEENEKHLPVDLDEFAEGLEGRGFKVDKIDVNNKNKILKMKLEKTDVQGIIESTTKPDDEGKNRQKRAYCMRCGGGHGGGWGGGHHHGGGGWGGGHHHGGGGGWGGYPDNSAGGGHYPGGGGGGGHYPGGGGGGGHYPGGGGGGEHYPIFGGGSIGDYPGEGHGGGHGHGGGCYGGKCGHRG